MIRNIKLGIKISTDNFNLIPEIYDNQDLIDYIEISIKPDFNIEEIKLINNIKLPYAIHLPNSNKGINFGDVNQDKNNLEFLKNLNENMDMFNKLNPICYIIHPESGDLNYSIKNLKKIKLKPLAIENMPIKGIRGEKLLGYDPDTLKIFFKVILDLEFCFDINHAIKASITLNEDYLLFLKKILKFKKPILFHIADGDLNVEIDNHLHLNEGEYNLNQIKKILLDFADIVHLTFETPRNLKNGINDDLKNMKIFLKL